MKETRYKCDPRQPYGLHDCRINGMSIVDGNLTISFLDEIYRIPKEEESGLNVKGSIVVEGIDEDFCNITITEVSKKTGRLHGDNISIREFVSKYKDFTFEVIDEYYGWQRFQFTGCLRTKNKCHKDMTLSIGYFTGDIIYKTEE